MIDPIPYQSTLPLPPNSPQLGPEHFRQLADARQAAKKIRRAVTMANFDGWTVGIFGGFSLMAGIIGGIDWSDLLVGGILVAIALVELHAAKKLGKLDPKAPRMLGYNQLALGGLIILYSVWRLHAGIGSFSAVSGDLATLDPDMARTAQEMTTLASRILYASLIVFAILAQGGLALYYFSRTRLVETYITTTPDWIISMQKSGVPL